MSKTFKNGQRLMYEFTDHRFKVTFVGNDPLEPDCAYVVTEGYDRVDCLPLEHLTEIKEPRVVWVRFYKTGLHPDVFTCAEKGAVKFVEVVDE
jgi:hypothetical protein